MKTMRSKRPIYAVIRWAGRLPHRKQQLVVSLFFITLNAFFFGVSVNYHHILSGAAVVHIIAIWILIHKLTKERNCAGISLKSQELSALFLAVKLCCSYATKYYIVTTILDSATLATTLWVIYMIRFKLQSTYMDHNDTLNIYYVVIPCALLSLAIHPSTSHLLITRIFLAFSVYLEAVSFLPQMLVMRNSMVIEPFTSDYVFALGVARFLSIVHFAFQIIQLGHIHGGFLMDLGIGLWPLMVLLSEIMQTFILADYCYYYIKSYYFGELVLHLPPCLA